MAATVGARVRPGHADAVRTDDARGRDRPDGPGPRFGGKVGLAYALTSRAADTDLALRLEPTITTGAGGVGEVLAILEDAARDQVYSTTKVAVAALVERGLEPATAQWLAMTTEKADDGVRFSYDLDAVRAPYDDHCQTDLLPEARALDDADRLGLVIAGKADVVPRDLGLKHTYVLAESGHNVHVDAPGCSASSWGRTARTGARCGVVS